MMLLNSNFLDNSLTFNKHLPNTYLYNYEKLKKFFPLKPFDNSVLEEVIKLKISTHYQRSEIAKILNESYQNIISSDLVKNNIELLKKENTLAILTGQQPVLLTGPLYIIYKAISIIKLSKNLKKSYPEYNFVPIFWVASDDHDLAEANQFNLLDINNNLNTFSFNIKQQNMPINQINISPSDTKELKDFLKNNLNETEFTDVLLNEIENIGNHTSNINNFFIELLQKFFNKHGLIILDGSNIDLKKLGKKIFEQEINEPEKLSHIAQKNGKILIEHGFHEQVNLTKDSCNFFIEENNIRKKVKYINKKFVIDNKEYSTNEILSKLESEPHVFSPNVLLRPIYQDFLLPTLIYMAGPSEISYYAQILNEGYKEFNIIPPIILPRASATIIENTNKKIMEKNNLNFDAIFNNKLEKIIKNKYEQKIDVLFNKYYASLDQINLELLKDIKHTTPEIADLYEKLIGSQHDELKKFKNQLIQKIKKDDEQTLKQLTRLYNHIYPNNVFQERSFNIFYYLNKYGDIFLELLYNSTIVDKPGHNIFFIS